MQRAVQVARPEQRHAGTYVSLVAKNQLGIVVQHRLQAGLLVGPAEEHAVPRTDQLDLGYLEIPAVVKLGLPLGMIKPSVFGGVGVGFNTTCEGDINGTAACDAFSSTEYSGIFGADVALYLGGISLWADGRYHVGLNDISGDLEFANDLKNRVWALQAGIGVVLGR